MVEDVSHSYEDGRVTLQPPESAVLFQQLLLLGKTSGETTGETTGQTGSETSGEIGGDFAAGSGAHLKIDGGGEDILDEA